MKVDLNKFIPEVTDIMKWIRYGFLMAMLMFTSIFGDDIREFYTNNTSESYGEMKDLTKRIQSLEIENVGHKSVAYQVDASTELIRELQLNQREINTQVENMTNIVREMQAREYQRLTRQ